MGDRRAVKAAKRGSDAFLRWVRNSETERIDLSGADLRHSDLRWTNFAGANLEGVDFTGAVLTGSYFGPATFRSEEPFVSSDDIPVNLRSTCFKNAVLLAATFNYPEMQGANFSNSYLGLANFRNVTFDSNSFKNAQLVNTAFDSCNMSGIIGLDSIQHYGPSHLDVETLYRSPSLSHRFLRQTGIPETLINYIPDLIASVEPIGFYSCFLSHATADKAFCDRLYARMVEAGLRVWYAPEDIRGGEQLVPQITKAIKVYDKVIIVLSSNSMRSQWVCNEIRWAQKRAATGAPQALFPISLVPFSSITAWEFIDPDTGTDIAANIRSYFIPDFSDYEDNGCFEKAFQRLYRDLKANAEQPNRTKGSFSSCPTCGAKATSGSFGVPFRVFQCSNCMRYYCYRCPGSNEGRECPDCRSDKTIV